MLSSRSSSRKKSIKPLRVLALSAVALAAFFAAPFLRVPIPDTMLPRLVGEGLPSQVRVEGVRWKPFFGQRFFVSRLFFSSASLRSLPGLGSLPEIDETAFLFRDAVFRFDPSVPGRRLRILKMRSTLLEFRGAVRWEKGRIQKADIAVFLPSAWAERLPEHWGRRLSSAQDDKKILKCAYKDHRLTFYGRSGPLLRAAC
jgi:hypothetical protein